MSTTRGQELNTWATLVLGDPKFYDRPGLESWSASEIGSDLSELLRDAGRALLKEDRYLQASFRRSPFYNDVGRGLSYWLFEHNLVYPIFREWTQTLDVLWDEREATWNEEASAWQRANSSAEERRKRHRYEPRSFLDLQVLDAGGQRWLFEAKWWNSVRTTPAIKADVTKLREHMKPRDRAFVLAFWYGSRASSSKDFDAETLQAIDVPPVCSVVFPSHVCNTWSGEAPAPEWGYFAMTAFEIPRRVDRERPAQARPR